MTFNLRKIMQIFIIFLVALVTGISVGKIYVDNLEAITVIEGGVDSVKEKDEVVQELVNSVQGKTVDKCTFLNAVEIYLIAEHKFYNAPEFYKIMTGVVNADAGVTKVNQIMKGERLKKDGKLYYNKLSPSTSSLAPQICSRFIYEYDSDHVDVYPNGTFAVSSPAKDLKGVFKEEDKQVYDLEKYKETFNTEPTTALSYIISSVSCPKGNYTSIKNNGNDTFTFTMTFDAKHTAYAGLIYAYEIAFSSGKGQPKWVSLQMDVTVDKDFNFVSIKYDEIYKMDSGVIGYIPVHDLFEEYMYFGDKVPSVEEVVGEVA